MPILEFPLDLPGVTRGALWEFHRDPAALDARLTQKKIRVVDRMRTEGAPVLLPGPAVRPLADVDSPSNRPESGGALRGRARGRVP